MSTRAVVFWLILAVALGAGAFLSLRSSTSAPKPGTVAVGAKLLSITPSSVRSIVVEHPDGIVDTIERSTPSAAAAIGSDAEWFLRTERAVRVTPSPDSAARPPASPWPLTTSRMQALLTKLRETECIAIPAPDAALDHPTVVDVTMADGSTCSLRLADRTLAGAGLVEVRSTPPTTGPDTGKSPTITRAVVADELHQVFAKPGPRAWRETAFLAALAADASRVSLETPRQKLSLAKVDGRWIIREPAAAPADPAAVQKLLTTLSNVSVDDFLDDGAPNVSTGLENPPARIVIASDRRTITGTDEPTVTTTGLEVAIGTASDTTGKKLFASIAGERMVLLDSRGLDSLSLDPGPYVWPGPTRTPAADIGIIAVEKSGADTSPAPSAGASKLKRSLSRWVRIGPDGTEHLLGEQEIKDVDALTQFFSGEDRSASGAAGGSASRAAPTISIVAPEGLRPMARLELRTLADAPLEIIEVGSAQTGMVTLKTGAIYRSFQVSRVPPLLMSLCATPAATGAKPEQADADK